MEINTSVFKIRTLFLLLITYRVIFFENFDVSKSKFKCVVLVLFNFMYNKNNKSVVMSLEVI